MTSSHPTARRGLLGGWTPPICLAWLVCELVLVWVLAGGTGWDMGEGTWLLLASAPGIALGVATGRERRTAWILPSVPLAVALATLVGSTTVADDGGDGFDAGLAFVYLLVVLAVPVLVGAALGAVWLLRR